MIDIPFYVVLPFDLKVFELIATFLFMGMLFAICLLPEGVRWYQILKAPRKTIIISAIIIFAFPIFGFVIVGYHKSTRIESAYTNISEYKEIADRIGMPLKPGLQQYLDTADAIASHDISWYHALSELSTETMLDIENYYKGNLPDIDASRWPPLSESEHTALKSHIDACVDWEQATDDFKATVGSYPVLNIDLRAMLEMIYNKHSIEWMDRGCFAQFAVPWAINN